MSFAIAIADLSKRYRLGSRRVHSYSTLRESIMEAVAATFRRLKSTDETCLVARYALGTAGRISHYSTW